MISHHRLQSYLREIAHEHYDAVRVPPFTLFFHPHDPLVYLNYAIPDEPVEGDLAAPLAALRAEFAARARVARFEYVEELAPGLAASLAAAGFRLELRAPLMICTRESYRRAPEVPGLEISRLAASAPEAELVAFHATQRQGFGLGEPAAWPAEVERLRRFFDAGRGFLGRLEGRPVGAAQFSAPRGGLTELVGIATLEPFRRRGIASRLVAEAVREAFACGVELAFLSAGDERAGHVYERAGFRACAIVAAWSDAGSGAAAG